MRRLRLEVLEFNGPLEWDWSLTEAGLELGRHSIRIPGTDWELPAFANLFAHTGWRTTAARRRHLEPAVARQLGVWAADRLLGDLVDHLRAPAIVEVVLPGPATALSLLPLEAMVVGDRTLALRRVTFVFHVCRDGRHAPPAPKHSPRDRLRILGVFSLPSGTTALALRRERVALTRLVEGMKGDIELRVLQYGTTREVIRQACADPLGWDIVHVSGHGEAAGIMLETPNSEPDPVSAEDLAELMQALRNVVSLVTLSSCESAALSGDAGLGRDLARMLDCAVMAMRFPVGDEFAAHLVLGVYDEMIGGRSMLPVALGTTLERLSVQLSRESQLSFSTPTLFGCRAASLTAFTTRTASTGHLPAAGIPAPPERFVGRVGLLARARRALAPDSPARGVVFQGMTGVGKTACARELIDISAGDFETVVWHSLPKTGAATDALAALVGFAETLDRHHPGLGLRGALSGARFETVTGTLADRSRQARVLTVLDDAEALIDAEGRWQLPEWEAVVAALSPDTGASRLVMTSRTPISGMYETCVVAPLSRDESIVVIREMPKLGELLERGSLPWLRIIERVLDLAQGHPAVLELAEAQAEIARPEALSQVLDEVEAGDTDFPQILVDWVEHALLALPEEQRCFFRFLCCLEEPDRQDLLAGGDQLDWDSCWTASGGTAPVGELLPPLLSAALVTRARGTPSIHPAVIAHVRECDPDFVADVTETIAGGWGYAFATSQSAMEEGDLTRLAAWRGLPYAARLDDELRLQIFASHILSEDHSQATSTVLRAFLVPAAAPERNPHSRRMLSYLVAKVERDLAPDSAEAMRSVIAEALADGETGMATTMGAELFEHLYRQGDLDAAEAQADAMIELVKDDHSTSGRLDRVVAERFRIDMLIRRGRYPEALAAGEALLEDIDGLTQRGELDFPGAFRRELALQRQRVLHALSLAARGLGRWEEELEYESAHIGELRRSGASPHDIATATYNTYFPLLKLGRVQDASAAVATARECFERAGDLDALGRILSAQGEIEIQRGNHELALELVGEGLRHSYRRPDVASIAVMHGVYGGTAFNTGRIRVAVAHLAVAAALHLQMGDSRATEDLALLDLVLRRGGTASDDHAAVAIIEATVGKGFRLLADRIGLAEGALAEACKMAQQFGGVLPAHLLAIWDPILSALAAARFDAEARVSLDQALSVQETHPDWKSVVSDIRSILNETGAPPSGVDEIDTALRERAQAAWAGRSEIRPNLWRAIKLRELLANVVRGAMGDGAGRERAIASIDEPSLSVLPLSARLRRILEGERDRDALVHGLDATAADVVDTLLDYLA